MMFYGTVNLKIDYLGGSNPKSPFKVEFFPAGHRVGSQRFKAENHSILSARVTMEGILWQEMQVVLRSRDRPLAESKQGTEYLNPKVVRN